MAISLLVYVVTFSGQLYFWRSYSSHFFRVTTSTQQLLFWSSYFFRASDFWRSSIFRTVTSLQQLFFQNSYLLRAKLLPSNHQLRTASSLGQLIVGRATFLVEGLLRIKISTEELLFRSRYFCTTSTFSEKLHFGKKPFFYENNIPYYPLFLESYFFRVATFSKDVIFHSSYLFRIATFHNILLQKSYYFAATLSFPQLHFLFISL